MRTSRLFAWAVTLLILIVGRIGAEAIQVNEWEKWDCLSFTKDMTTEWLIADRGAPEYLPEDVTIYVLVPPTVTQVGRHWEITFDSTGQKQKQLAEHFNNDLAIEKFRSGHFEGRIRGGLELPLLGNNLSKARSMWLIVSSKEACAGQHAVFNADPDDSDNLRQFNLDPDDALGIAFIEPVVVEKNGEWIIKIKDPPTEQEKAYIISDCSDWNRQHPGPPSPQCPTEIYPPKIQKKYDAWHAAWVQWRDTQPGGFSPKVEDFFQFTPEQQKQYAEWEKAKNDWVNSGGVGAFPQPRDFLKDDDSSSDSTAHP